VTGITVRRAIVSLTLLFAAACASLVPGRVTPASEWKHTLDIALRQANQGHFEAADSTLANFASTHAGSNEALETAYWRAVFKLDPSNRAASVPQAIASLDGYLMDNRPRQHITEATTLRRAAAQLEALNRLAATASSQAREAASSAANAKAAASEARADARAANADASSDAKDAEIKRLRDELAKANTELERIRKRLGNPPGRP
jgi:hypothetical protein